MSLVNTGFWMGLFDVVGRGFDFFSGLLRKSSEPSPVEQPDAEAQRAGTATGAAAHAASHSVDKVH
jgi:hypothetical protein